MKKKLKILKFFDQNNIGSLPRIFLCSLAILFFFYSMPLIIDINNTQEFKNNSKKVLAYTLNNKSISGSSENGEILDERELLIDILSLNEIETDTVRLNASTIKQLFEDTDYKLSDVREKKLVKPIALTLLPAEIKMIENTKKRKEFFIQIVLPLVLKENNNIKLDRKRLFSIINKSHNSELEKKMVEEEI